MDATVSAPTFRHTTHELRSMQRGDPRASHRFWERINPRLRRMAAGILRLPGNLLQPTVLVNETWLKLAPQTHSAYSDSAHFMRVAAHVMRRLVVDAARRDTTAKRGGEIEIVALSEDEAAPQCLELPALDEALDLLARAEPRWAQVVEMKFFAGMTTQEIAGALGVSTRTAEGDWKFARAWLRGKLRG